MFNIKKSYLITSVASFSVFFASNVYAFDQFITVKFKQNVSTSFLQELNKMTNTKVEKNLGNNTYKLKIEGVANNATVDKYSEMFLIMKNIQSVSPLPKVKKDDYINPFYYMNITPNKKAQDNKNTQTTNNQPQMQSVPDELIVKFNKNTPAEDIQSLNQGLGGNVTYMKDTDSYKVKLPDYVDNEYAMNFYQNNGLVESVKQNEIAADPKASEEQKESDVNVQEGVALSIPLNGTDVKVTFKIGEEEEGYKWFEEVFGAQMVSKKGFHTYIVRFPENINPKFAARAVKACSAVQSSEVASE